LKKLAKFFILQADFMVFWCGFCRLGGGEKNKMRNYFCNKVGLAVTIGIESRDSGCK